MFKIQIQLRIRDITNGCIFFITLLITNFSTFFDAKNYVGEKNVMNIIREQEVAVFKEQFTQFYYFIFFIIFTANYSLSVFFNILVVTL